MVSSSLCLKRKETGHTANFQKAPFLLILMFGPRSPSWYLDLRRARERSVWGSAVRGQRSEAFVGAGTGRRSGSALAGTGFRQEPPGSSVSGMSVLECRQFPGFCVLNQVPGSHYLEIPCRGRSEEKDQAPWTCSAVWTLACPCVCGRSRKRAINARLKVLPGQFKGAALALSACSLQTQACLGTEFASSRWAALLLQKGLEPN